jgi:pyridoxal phosphate enzyme (YggS family)
MNQDEPQRPQNMAIDQQQYKDFLDALGAGVRLVAVSKTKPPEDIRALYDLGQRDFGENYVQELADKRGQLPADIRWHFIGHLQSNKVKIIAPFIHLIQSVDSLKLLREIDKHGAKWQRVIDCLLQVHIAREETKFGFDAQELGDLFHRAPDGLQHVRIAGLMGIASFTEDPAQVRKEFSGLKTLWDKYFHAAPAGGGPSSILSMGMSADYKMAIGEGSNMVRIGSLLFGERP